MTRALVSLFAALIWALSPAYAQVPGIPIGPGGGGGGGGSGTVTSIATSCGASGGTITTTGTITAVSVPITDTTTTPPYTSIPCGGTFIATNTSAKSTTLPQAGTGAYTAGWFTEFCNAATGTWTIYATTSTIAGVAGATGVAINGGTATAPLCMTVKSDGANYQVSTVTSGSGGAFTNPITATLPSFANAANQLSLGGGAASPYNGGSFPAFSGLLAIGGTYAAAGEPASSADGNAWIGLSTGKGLELGGRGTAGDISFFNANGSLVCYIPHGVSGMDCGHYRVDASIDISDAGSTYYPLIYAPNTNTGGGTTVAANTLGVGPPVPVGMSTAAFQITTGASGTFANSTTLTFANNAKTGWNCTAQSKNNPTSHIILQTGNSVNTVVLTDYTPANPHVAQNFVANDVLFLQCMAY